MGKRLVLYYFWNGGLFCCQFLLWDFAVKGHMNTVKETINFGIVAALTLFADKMTLFDLDRSYH